MAFSVTSVYAGVHSALVTVTATADADTGGTISHGVMVGTPLVTVRTPLVAPHYAGQDAHGQAGATTVTYTKGTAVGSGHAAARALLWLLLPHSVMK